MWSQRDDWGMNGTLYKSKRVDLLDKLILKYGCVPLARFFHVTGHTANSISLYGLFFTLGSLYYLWKDDMLRFSVYFWITYLLDCLDGYYARRYNMISFQGDVFEHVRDVVSLVAMVFICCVRYVVTARVIVWFVLSSILTGIHVGCVQKDYVHDHFESLDVLQVLCFDGFIRGGATSLYGVGAYMLTLNAIVLYLSQGLSFVIRLVLMLGSVVYFCGRYVHASRSDRDENVEIPITLLTKPGQVSI